MVLPSMNGLSWLGVEVTSNLPLFFTSHAQPEPKRVVAAALNFALNSSKLPKVAAMSAAKASDGTPDSAAGASMVQNAEWFMWPPPLLRTAVLMASGTMARLSASSSSSDLSASSGAEFKALLRFVT